MNVEMGCDAVVRKLHWQDRNDRCDSESEAGIAPLIQD